MSATDNKRANYDELIQTIADYALTYIIDSDEAYTTARYSFIDSLGCGFLALQYPACAKLLGPIVPGTHVPLGARVPGTAYYLDPIKAAFDIGAMVRWLDYNDTWLAAEWGHPSDNIGAILALADYVSRYRIEVGEKPLRLIDVLTMMIKAHEIQGILALNNSFNRVGLDHVILVKLASVAVSGVLLGLSREQLCAALSHVWLDGNALRTYRHAPNTGPRKSWAASDATSRAVRLALFVQQGEMGYPSALTAKNWGFQDVCFNAQPITLTQTLGSYVMENVLFKINYPAEFHAQTALECAVKLHPEVKDKIDQISRIDVITTQAAMRIINKSGPLYNPADRDHCLQYIIAIGLLKGALTADDYEDGCASDIRIDQLREKMHIAEDSQFSQDYYDANKRSIANAIQVHFADGGHTRQITIEYPIGHRRRRDEGIPLLQQKYCRNLQLHFDKKQADKLYAICADHDRFCKMPVPDFMDLCVPGS